MPNRHDFETLLQSIHAPSPEEPPVPAKLSTSVAAALLEHVELESLVFENDEALDCVGTALEFTGCTFRHCTFARWQLKRISFVDCVLDH